MFLAANRNGYVSCGKLAFGYGKKFPVGYYHARPETTRPGARSAENRNLWGGFQVEEGQIRPIKYAVQRIIKSNAEKDRNELAE